MQFATRDRKSAFTLVELLVVITIILALLALLMPAMDKAVYRAELASCGSRLKAVGTSLQTYAFNHNRQYPHRLAVSGSNAAQFSKIANSGFDDRDLIAPYLSINRSLQCPFVRQIDVDDKTDGPGQHIYISYSLFHGWKFRDARATRAMRRLGDRFDWDGDWFDVLAADVDGVRPEIDTTYGSHPDLSGRLAMQYAQKEPFLGFGTITLSWWASTTTDERPPVDFNYMFANGEVRTIEQVRYNEWDPAVGRGSFVKVPESNTTDKFDGHYSQLPLR